MRFTEASFKRRVSDSLSDGSAQALAEPDHLKPVAPQEIDFSGLRLIPDNDSFIREAYRQILGREADPYGFIHFRELLRSGKPRSVVLNHLISSEENKESKRIRGTAASSAFPGAVPHSGFAALRKLHMLASHLARRTYQVLFKQQLDVLEHKIDYLLRQVDSRADRLASKNDESLWTLSRKLDEYTQHLRSTLAADANAARDVSEHLSAAVAEVSIQTGDALSGVASLSQVASRVDETLAMLSRRMEDASGEQLQVLRTQSRRLSQATASLSLLAARHEEAVRVLAARHEEAVRVLAARHEEAVHVLAARHEEASHNSRQLAEQLLAVTRALTSMRESHHAGVQSLEQNVRELSVQLQQTRSEIHDVRSNIHPSIVPAGDVLVTEVDGLIIAAPAREWRIAAYHAFRGLMEPGVISVLKRAIGPGMVFVDVGAHIGVHTLQAARLVGTSGEVHSFEPTPETLSILKQNIQVNGLAEEGIVHVYPEAVSDRNGPATLAVFGNNSGHNTIFGDGAESFSIPVLTVALDEKLPDRRIDLVKIDAEGAEPSIIAGMRKTIARNPGMPIILEFAPAHLRRAGWEPLAFLQDLRRLGLNISLIDDLTGDLRGFEDETLAGVFSANLWLQCSRPCESGS